MNINNEIVKKVREWLGESGKKFFNWCIEKYDSVSPIYMEEGIPHPVHFREGMKVRNFMRSTGLCDDWTSHDLDNNWMEIVEKALSLEEF